MSAPLNAPCVDVAIVGGGSVAVSFLYQLLAAHVPGTPLTIALFEPGETVGPGSAYQHDLPSNLLNIPVNRMSAVAAAPDSFLEWLRALDPLVLREAGVEAIDPGGVVPRPLFGRYLQDLYARALDRAQRQGVTVRHVRERVVGAWRYRVPTQEAHATQEVQGTQHTPIRTHAIVQGAGGTRLCASHVVLCNGNLPSTAFPALAHLPGYFNSPYPVADMTQRIGAQDAVCIVGTSLSAIDAIAALDRAGHQGPIHCISRNGRLPAVRSPHNRRVTLPRLPEPETDGRTTLDGLLDSLRRALRAAGGQEDPNDVLGLAGPADAALDEEIRRSQAGPRPWQAVAAATNERIEHIWHALDDAERARFHRDWRTLWMARRATFPMGNALILQRLLHDGRLHVQGGFQSVRYDAASGEFVLAHGTGELRAAWLINATSFSMTVATSDDPLMRQLCADGLARAHPLGGLDLDFDTGCLIDDEGRPVDSITVLGSLAAGTYFWTTSMEINARLAAGQADRIAAALAARGVMAL